ncbi:type II CRISPR-associated endonuclease Cas1 [uncultured Sphaerochaeta sp.]|uniref:type II CRISPR-associated endonuclease Cas1 n=1 Tax=uncultured Sphaerochaeta sp. TaxID=886478 RepID=UPI002A0A4411|nr:type II CRISPR-associated endonuclease Cas1 [uncultured Sphaerochaeta sp.]
MVRKVVEISKDGLFLSLERGFLIVSEGSQRLDAVPLSDIAVLLVTAQGTYFSKHILLALTSNGAAIILCGKSFKPESIILPLFGNYEFSGRLDTQIAVSMPLKKQLWKTIIQEKIKNQSFVLQMFGKDSTALLLENYSNQVLSGDSSNREAIAAKAYWNALLGDDFIRDPNLPGINSFLNYGYAILRGIIARAVCCVGLHPSLGIFHCSKVDNYRLVDDLMEPFRPLLDCLVIQLPEAIVGEELTPKLKKKIYQIAWTDVIVEKGKSPLIKAVEYYAYSLYLSYKEKRNIICIPALQRNANLLDQSSPLPF